MVGVGYERGRGERGGGVGPLAPDEPARAGGTTSSAAVGLLSPKRTSLRARAEVSGAVGAMLDIVRGQASRDMLFDRRGRAWEAFHRPEQESSKPCLTRRDEVLASSGC